MFHRESLEPETVTVWVNELRGWKFPDSATTVAKHMGLHQERFPSLSEFRRAYLERIKRDHPPLELEEVTTLAEEERRANAARAHEMIERLSDGLKSP